MFDSGEDWVWDSWLADDGGLFHLFFLCAPRSLKDPEQRHWHARLGHATSSDLRTWTRLPDPELARKDGFDDRAIWTGSIVRDHGVWRMFRTGISRAEAGPVQRIGSDVSANLLDWTSVVRGSWPLVADLRWYEKSSTDEHWRDPWVVQDSAGLWHMYITARVSTSSTTGEGSTAGAGSTAGEGSTTDAGVGPGLGRGVIGHAISADLENWEVRPPLSLPERFEQLEVIQVVEVEGRWALIFSCQGAEMTSKNPGSGGVWSVPIQGPGRPVDLALATRLTDECVYVGRVIQDRNGTWQMLAFVNRDHAGAFVGGITDPVEVGWTADGSGLTLVGPSVPWCDWRPRHN